MGLQLFADEDFADRRIDMVIKSLSDVEVDSERAIRILFEAFPGSVLVDEAVLADAN